MDVFKLIIFQEDGLGEQKIAGISAFGEGIIISNVFDLKSRELPQIIDEPEFFVKDDFDGDLALIFVNHPDILSYVVRLCKEKGIVCVAPGKRIEGAICPETCCSLRRDERLGKFGERFGIPELEVRHENGVISEVHVIRGAPCGSTWVAGKKILGLKVDEALERFAREIQYLCYRRNNVNIYKEKMPIHIAGEMHFLALKKAIR